MFYSLSILDLVKGLNLVNKKGLTITFTKSSFGCMHYAVVDSSTTRVEFIIQKERDREKNGGNFSTWALNLGNE